MLTRRALGLFWLCVLLAGGMGAAGLAWLGPPERAREAASPGATPATAPAPAPAASPVTPVPPAPDGTPVAQPLPAAAPAPAGLPSAPEPPPLSEAVVRRAPADASIAAPDPQMLERTRHGLVPRLGPEGRTSIRLYARPFDREDRRPRIGLVLGGMGLNAQHSEEAIRRLPGAVTLAFSPYALRPEPLQERARARGMEMLTALPLEPAGFGSRADPGDRALLTGLGIAENLDRLDWALSRIQGQVGAIGAEGSMRGERFAQNGELLATLQTVLTERGLLYVEPRPGGPQPARAFGRAVDLVLDEPSPTRAEVTRRLLELESLARQNGSALGLVGDPVPSVVAAIEAWATGLEERAAVLAPITVLLRRPAESAAR
jgi:hypothetical protein